MSLFIDYKNLLAVIFILKYIQCTFINNWRNDTIFLNKTISIDAADAVEIDKAIKKGEADSISDFIRKSVRFYLKNKK